MRRIYRYVFFENENDFKNNTEYNDFRNTYQAKDGFGEFIDYPSDFPVVYCISPNSDYRYRIADFKSTKDAVILGLIEDQKQIQSMIEEINNL